MNVKIQGGGGGIYANTGSCTGVTTYLQHEDLSQLQAGQEQEHFFNQDRDKVIYIIGVEHGKTREVINGKVTYKNRWGKVVTRRATKREKRGEDPFYWRFVELGFTAVGTKRDGSGHKVAGKRFLTQALPEASQEAIRAMQNAFNDSIRQGELTGP